METIQEKNAATLNDLIQINNDRVQGYEKAAKETEAKDADLRSLFTTLAADSRSYVAALSRYVKTNGEDPAEGTTLRGKIYRAWMDVKATFGGKGRKAILASCEQGEDAAQKAYKEALKDDLSTEVRDIIAQQQTDLKKSHDKIKAMRDAQPA